MEKCSICRWEEKKKIQSNATIPKKRPQQLLAEIQCFRLVLGTLSQKKKDTCLKMVLKDRKASLRIADFMNYFYFNKVPMYLVIYSLIFFSFYLSAGLVDTLY